MKILGLLLSILVLVPGCLAVVPQDTPPEPASLTWSIQPSPLVIEPAAVHSATIHRELSDKPTVAVSQAPDPVGTSSDEITISSEILPSAPTQIEPVSDETVLAAGDVIAQNSNSGPWRVQVIAVSKESSAMDVEEELRSQGAEHVVIHWRDGLYKVMVGAFRDKADAVEYQDELVKLGYKGAFVVRLAQAGKMEQVTKPSGPESSRPQPVKKAEPAPVALPPGQTPVTPLPGQGGKQPVRETQPLADSVKVSPATPAQQIEPETGIPAEDTAVVETEAESLEPVEIDTSGFSNEAPVLYDDELGAEPETPDSDPIMETIPTAGELPTPDGFETDTALKAPGPAPRDTFATQPVEEYADTATVQEPAEEEALAERPAAFDTYRVQILSMDTKFAAEEAAREAKNNTGYDAIVREGGGAYNVLVGEFSSADAAKRAKNMIEMAGYDGAFVVGE